MMKVAVVGGGPAGLMAAETAAAGGAQVDLYDAMPSVGRKFLLAGKGGLNLTHAEPLETFLSRYGSRRAQLTPIVRSFGPDAIREWASGLGIRTFIGTSRRIFPADMKAAPLLRAWLRRLRQSDIRFHVRHRWTGWDEGETLLFQTPTGEHSVHADAVILAPGGASWPKLGADASWVPLLHDRGVEIAPLRPANCGFDVEWSVYFKTRFAGQPVKSVALFVTTRDGAIQRRQGEFVITETGVEGGVIYAVSSALRDEIEREGRAVLTVDLTPDRDQVRLEHDLSCPQGKRTIATHLRRYAGISGVKSALLREVLPREAFADPAALAAAIKSLPLVLRGTRPLSEAISTAGGVRFEDLDERLMLRGIPGLFCAGEMLDWEAPTGGYLLTACLATGRWARAGALKWFMESRTRPRT
ncbi:MAG: TIGR03862 family flavoprotein [Nitrospira sp.]|nr:TIGR03862 family flavoprotein [Nitrospira sp.]